MALPSLADVAAGYAATILAAVQREYPNAPRHITTGPDDRPTPREAHPAFYGCFDWHSAVEMHWALVRLLRRVPHALDAAAAHELLAEHLTPAALSAEAEYLRTNPGYERPYGWGWALALAEELAQWTDPAAAGYRAAFEPLAATVTEGFLTWLPKARYPERVGMHANSAFALVRSLPHARRCAASGQPALLEEITAAALRWFGADRNYPAAWEPGGADFLSGALTEAELIAASLEQEAFAGWLWSFLPELADGKPSTLLTPVQVPDDTDGQLAHLHGLNLYRAYAFGLLAERLPADDLRVSVLLEARDRHASAALPAVTGSDWMVEHWLAAYAVLVLA